MRLAILKKEISSELPKGVILFLRDDSFKDNEYKIEVSFIIEKNDFKNSEELSENLIFVKENPDYRRTKKQLEIRNSNIAEKIREHNLQIDWRDNQNGKVEFNITESNGFHQKFTMKKVKDIFHTVHLFYDIVDSKLQYLEN